VRQHIFRASRLAALFCAFMGMAVAASAQAPAAEEKLGASDNTELGLVLTGGNASSSSIGVRNVFTYKWTNATFSWEAGWVRAASRDGDRYAVPTLGGFDVVEPPTAIDSQRLFSKVRYQRQLSARTDWFGNFDTVRDEPSNINRQFVLAGGLGTTWRKTERLTFRTAYGLSYTDEDLDIEGENRFAGYRLFYGLKALPQARTTIESELTFDGSFDNSDDVRTDWLNGVSVSINSSMALKSSLRVLYRNVPALEEIDLVGPFGVVLGSVDVEKKKLDTALTTSLVITF
jgi:hypothetical protein